jgi:prevent-host-death family protein
MEVTVTELRAHLRQWLAAARRGENVVITERGVPVAKLVRIDEQDVIDRLTREGVLSPAKGPKRKARMPTITPTPGPPISDLVSEMRR